MLARRHGSFDAVVAMDSLIHYAPADAAAALAALTERTGEKIVFTFAPKTPALALMHAAGRLFPRGNKAPAIQPVGAKAFARRLAEHGTPLGWHVGRTERVSHGFYTSQAMEIVRS